MLQPTASSTPSTLQNSQEWRRPKPMSKGFVDIEGQNFGTRLVLGYAGRRFSNNCWQCRCIACGKESAVTAYGQGLVKSPCRCQARRGFLPPRYTHGQSHHKREYATWSSMKSRCGNPLDAGWADYGGRGIRVCPRWRDPSTGFINFLADMGPRPEGKSIDRIKNNLDYEPGNCRWATRAEQARNRRSNHLMTFEGQTLPLIDWASKIGMDPIVLWSRARRKWSPERALTTPVRVVNRDKISHKGRTLSRSAWALVYGLSKATLNDRIHAGWTTKQVLETPLKGARV